MFVKLYSVKAEIITKELTSFMGWLSMSFNSRVNRSANFENYVNRSSNYFL